jgi:hypothetical protein
MNGDSKTAKRERTRCFQTRKLRPEVSKANLHNNSISSTSRSAAQYLLFACLTSSSNVQDDIVRCVTNAQDGDSQIYWISTSTSHCKYRRCHLTRSASPAVTCYKSSTMAFPMIKALLVMAVCLGCIQDDTSSLVESLLYDDQNQQPRPTCWRTPNQRN